MPQFLGDDGDAKVVTIPRVFSENSRAKNYQSLNPFPHNDAF